MSFNIKEIFHKRSGENFELFGRYINPQFSKVLKTIGFDKIYTKGMGPYLYDSQGSEYLDFLSGYGVFAIGRNHPLLAQSIKDFLDVQASNMVQMDAPLLAGILAEKLISVVGKPNINIAFFTNSGTESNEAAIKFAKAATGRNRILFLDHAFHGLSTGSLSLNGNTEFREGFGDLLPGCEGVALNDLESLEKELKKEDVAAFFVEPIQGKGVYIPEDHFLPQAQNLCRKYGTLLVADEVQTGLGRTGRWFGYEHWDLEPDIITISKALSGGMVPVGATLTSRAIYDKVFSRMDRCIVHSSTFGKNNLAMVCGLATLSILENENLIENSRVQGEKLVAQLKAMAPKHEWIKEIRGKGLMIGIEFGKPASMANKIKWNMVHGVDKGLFGELIVMPLLAKHKVLTQVSGHHQDIVKLLPTLVINQKHIDHFVNSLDSVLEDCGKISGPMWEMGKNLAKHALSNKNAVTA
ncbi:MAG TPA: aspartate aminotransferase family protein [Deltaproteobacteria bacterium]|nr:aspartate aminotransferase family protein [Deltaproteobacteria bacterium]